MEAQLADMHSERPEDVQLAEQAARKYNPIRLRRISADGRAA
jgi:hypothetical protein